jgi:hypothetical protein
VNTNTPAGTYPITVTGNPGNVKTQFNLVIQTSNSMSVTCTPSANTSLLGQDVTWTASITGGTQPYTYVWSGSGIPANPAPGDNPYTIKYSTVGVKTATVAVIDAESRNALCNTSTVRVNFVPKFEEF